MQNSEEDRMTVNGVEDGYAQAGLLKMTGRRCRTRYSQTWLMDAQR